MLINKLISLIYRCFNNIKILIYPAYCWQCHTSITNDMVFCLPCMETIKPIVSYLLPITTKYIVPIFAISAYENPVKQLVLQKFSHNVYASHAVAKLMVMYIPMHTKKYDYIIPVPLHWTRYAIRGFNQANEIAKGLEAVLKVPVITFLQRSKKTSFQSKLSSEQRYKNMIDAFTLHPWYRFFNKYSIIENKDLLIIDDIYTSGATIKSLCKTLLFYKPASITCLVACRTT